MTAIPRVGKPANAAFEAAGIRTLEALARHSEAELLAIHGVGPKGIALLKPALAAVGLTLMPGKG